MEQLRGAFMAVYTFDGAEAIERAHAVADELPYTFPPRRLVSWACGSNRAAANPQSA